eukprot:COSAG02_NODE_6539_length_3509_cov_1.903226_2_plen_734_part_00
MALNRDELHRHDDCAREPKIKWIGGGKPWKAGGNRKQSKKKQTSEVRRWKSKDVAGYTKTIVAYVDPAAGSATDLRAAPCKRARVLDDDLVSAYKADESEAALTDVTALQLGIEGSKELPKFLLHVYTTAKRLQVNCSHGTAPSGGLDRCQTSQTAGFQERFVDKAEALLADEASPVLSGKRKRCEDSSSGDSDGLSRVYLVWENERVWAEAKRMYMDSVVMAGVDATTAGWEGIKSRLQAPQSEVDHNRVQKYLLNIVKILAQQWERKAWSVVEGEGSGSARQPVLSGEADTKDKRFLLRLQRYSRERFNDQEGSFVDGARQGCLVLQYVPASRLCATDFVDLVRAYPDEFAGLGLAGAFCVQKDLGAGRSMRDRICAIALEKIPACSLQYLHADGVWSDHITVNDFKSRLGKELSEDTVVRAPGCVKPMPFHTCRAEFDGYPGLWMPAQGLKTPNERCRLVRDIVCSSRTGSLLRAHKRLAWAKACVKVSQVTLVVDLVLTVGALIDPVRLVDRRILSELRVDTAAAQWVVPNCNGQRLLHVAARCGRAELVEGLLDLGHDSTARDDFGEVAAKYGCAEAFSIARPLPLLQWGPAPSGSSTSSSARSEWSDPLSDPAEPYELTQEDMMSTAVPREKAARSEAFRAARKHYERMDREDCHGETRFVFQHKGLVFIADVSREYIIDIQTAERKEVWRKTVPLEKRHRWVQEAKAREAKREAKRAAKRAATKSG